MVQRRRSNVRFTNRRQDELLSVNPLSFSADGQVLELNVQSQGPRSVTVKTRSPEIIADLFAATAAHLRACRWKKSPRRWMDTLHFDAHGTVVVAAGHPYY